MHGAGFHGGGMPGGVPGGGMHGGGYAPHRAPLILVLGITSFFALFIGCSACGPLALGSLGLSIPAIVLGRRDLEAIRAGTMDPSGRDMTQVGVILSIVSSIFSAVIGVIMVVLVALYGGLIGAALLMQPS